MSGSGDPTYGVVTTRLQDLIARASASSCSSPSDVCPVRVTGELEISTGCSHQSPVRISGAWSFGETLSSTSSSALTRALRLELQEVRHRLRRRQTPFG